MSVVSTGKIARPGRAQGPWDARNVAELSQTNFRTALRGYDRDEVRAILESVAADYRVLQLQNASLQRQLADLEAVLEAYHSGDGGANDTALSAGNALQRAHEEARAILMRAHAQAEETMARVTARVREAERPLEQLEHDQRNFRALLASTISELIGVLNTTGRAPGTPAAEGDGSLPIALPAISNAIATLQPPADDADRHGCETALVPLAHAARPSLAAADLEPIDGVLKDIDEALVEIPALQCE